MSLALNYPYNQKIAKKLSQYYYTWEPMGISEQRTGKGMYALPGVGPDNLMLNMVEQRLYDTGKVSKGEAIMKVQPSKSPVPKGGARKKPSKAQVAHEIANSFEKSELSGGSINWDRVREVATPILKNALSKGLDVGLPALGKAVGNLIEHPDIGEMVGKIGRELVKSTTGYGRKAVRGGASKKPTISQVSHEIANSFEKSELSGGSINWDRVREVATPILKKALSAGLDVGAPALGTAVGTAIGGPAGASVGLVIGQLGRELIKTSTGYGRKGAKKSKDVGVYKGGSKPKASKSQGGRNERNEIVKKIMKEKGMSLPMASKYVKEHNLY